MDERDKIVLDAQRQFYDSISQVRRELSADAKEMRADLIAAFNRAHDENKERMEAISRQITAHAVEDAEHAKEDNRRFTVINRAVFGAAGALALLVLALQVYNAVFK